MIKFFARFILFVSLLLLVQQVSAQIAVPFKSKTGDSTKTVYIWHADTLREVKKDSIQIQSLFGHVKIQSENTMFYCDSLAINHKDNFMEAYGNVHIIDSDTTNIYSQYMKYFVDTKNIIFTKKVSLKDGKGTLTTEELHYDMNMHIGNYYQGGRVVSEKTVVTSTEGTYYADTKDVYFKKNVVLVDPAYTLKADSLLYNSQTRLATFITMTHIVDSSGRKIDTRDGFYNLQQHHAEFGKRPTITDHSQSITGDEIRFDDSTGINIATGNAVFKDTLEGISVIAGKLVADKFKNTLTATIVPLMIIKEENDSLYVRADTLFSGKIPDSVLFAKDSLGNPINKIKPDSSLRYLQGYHHVRIFSDSLQAVSDSMYYSGLDSIFQLYTNPVAWASGYQITGDTMFLYTKNKKPDRLYVFENSLVVGKTGPAMYNQVKGNTLNGYFKDGVIDYMRAKGSAESVYYIKDDSMAFVGVNKVTRADVIDMIFLNKLLNKVVLRNDAEGTMYPIKKVNYDEMKLRNFKWLEDRRPKTKYELFEN